MPAATQNLIFLRVLLKRAWVNGVHRASRELLKVLASGKKLDKAVIDLILKDIKKKAVRATEAYATETVKRIVNINEVNLKPLQSMLKEREKLFTRHLKSFRFTISQDAKKLMKLRFDDDWLGFLKEVDIGRRGQDVIREVSLKALERGFLQGSPTILTKSELIKDIMVLNNGQTTFSLEIFPYKGKFRQYNVKNYAELVALSTSSEASQVAFIMQAKKMGTELLKYNKIRKPYKELKDPVCDKLNGNIFSLNPKGSKGKSGKFYPYIKTVLTRGYWIAHPRCNHIGRPKLEAFA